MRCLLVLIPSSVAAPRIPGAKLSVSLGHFAAREPARRYAGRKGEFRWLGQLTFLDDTEFDPEAIRLSLDQLERRGPGLVAYYQHPTGGQFISWVE